MRPLFCLCSLFTLLVRSEYIKVYSLQEGESITITCSKCTPQNYDGLYLFVRFLDDRDHKKNKVLFSSQYPPPVVQDEFTDEVDLNGSFPDLSITIKNLTVKSEGVYSCTYRFSDKKDICQIYILRVKEQKNHTKNTPKCDVCPSDSQNLVATFIIVCLFFLVVIAFILLFPRVKQRVKRENDTEQNGPMNHQSSTEYVYEEMRKNPVYSRVSSVQSPQA